MRAKGRIIKGMPDFCCPAIMALMTAYPPLVFGFEQLPELFGLFLDLIVAFINAAFVGIWAICPMAGTLVDPIV